MEVAPFLLSQLILRVGKKSQCSSSLWSWQLLLSICESLLGGSSKSHISVLITVHKWNFYKCFSKVTFWGEILFWKQILDYLEFFGFTLCFRIFQAKKNFFSNFFSTNSRSLFVDLLQKQKPVLDWDCSLKTGKKDWLWDRRSQQDWLRTAVPTRSLERGYWRGTN